MSRITVRAALLATSTGIAGLGGAAGVLDVACDPQVDAQYRGEPLATIHGTVVAESTAAPAPMDVQAAVLWIRKSSTNNYQPSFVGTTVSASGSFPASFTLDMFQPPPADAEWHYGVEIPSMPNLDPQPMGTPAGIWAGYLAAISPLPSDSVVHPSDILGIDTQHVVVYLDLAVSAEAGFSVGFAASNFNVPVTKGYHLAKVDAEQQSFARSASDCLFGNVCAHTVGPPGIDEWTQARNDWSYARCTRIHPSNQTCTETLDPDGGPASDASAQCQTLASSVVSTSLLSMCSPGPEGSVAAIYQLVNFTSNPNGLSDPSTIELGTTIWDAYFLFGFNPGLLSPGLGPGGVLPAH